MRDTGKSAGSRGNTDNWAGFDTMNHVKSPVTTVRVGIAASMASFTLAGGERGKRKTLFVEYQIDALKVISKNFFFGFWANMWKISF
jgi:hypothetical protein